MNTHDTLAAGSDSVRVNPDLVVNGSISEAAWSADGSHIACRADQVTDQVFELFSVRPDSSANTRASGALSATAPTPLWSWFP